MHLQKQVESEREEKTKKGFLETQLVHLKGITSG